MTDKEFRKEYMGMCISDKEVIEFLEIKNKELKKRVKEAENDSTNCEIWSYEKITTLEKEIAELKKDKEWLDNTNNEQTEVILKLQAQIKDMKCCGNCKHHYERKVEQGGRCKDHYSDSVCENYESDEMTADKRLHNEWD